MQHSKMLKIQISKTKDKTKIKEVAKIKEAIKINKVDSTKKKTMRMISCIDDYIIQISNKLLTNHFYLD